MILRDPYAGHRPESDIWWVPDPVKDTQWTDWDYTLLEANRVIDMLENSSSGQLRNLAEDPDVYWEVGYRVDYGDQELQRFRKDNEAEPGVTFYLMNPQKRNDEPFWGVTDWLKSLEVEQAVDRSAPEGARPPTPEELTAIRERRMAAVQDSEVTGGQTLE